jgi:magnesium-transporting ATPase (P-type)
MTPTETRRGNCSPRACAPTAEGSTTASTSPVEVAIAEAAGGRGIDAEQLFAEREVVRVEPFDSERKRMSVTVESPAGRTLFAKGAPEKMLERLADGWDRAALRALSDDWAGRGMRVLIVAKRDLAPGDEEDRELTPLGILGVQDAARPGGRS